MLLAAELLLACLRVLCCRRCCCPVVRSAIVKCFEPRRDGTLSKSSLLSLLLLLLLLLLLKTAEALVEVVEDSSGCLSLGHSSVGLEILTVRVPDHRDVSNEIRTLSTFQSATAHCGPENISQQLIIAAKYILI